MSQLLFNELYIPVYSDYKADNFEYKNHPDQYFNFNGFFNQLYIHKTRTNYQIRGFGFTKIPVIDKSGERDIYYQSKDINECIRYFVFMIKSLFQKETQYQLEY